MGIRRKSKVVPGKHVILGGKVKRGRMIASGLAFAAEIPETKSSGTIELQKIFFAAAGVEHIYDMHSGTINLDISPNKFEILNPDYEVTCEWARGVEETFHFVKATIFYKDVEYDGYIYYPCPSRFKSHGDNIVGLLTYKIPEVNYGVEISAKVPSYKIRII
uniref:Uncharacterized protein n=2 Tax=Parcubacteria group TaxID=1794811 RepID=A0A0H4T461_9BACT|nr:hypothetical protein [uncultured Parcubacteria bacterium Rifle_16ft_4_minimus_37647]